MPCNLQKCQGNECQGKSEKLFRWKETIETLQLYATWDPQLDSTTEIIIWESRKM